MHRKRRLNIQDLNPHLICVLCGGYFIDATTIIECLHSFCRACIVQHLEGSKYCPICDVQVHKTKPLQNIRQDPALQDIVYKLVPGLFQNEMRCRREFLSRHPDTVLPSSSTSSVTIYTPDEKFNITLEYWKCSTSTSQEDKVRYLRCPGAVSILHLHKLIQAKFDLSPSHIIEFLYKDEILQDYLTLLDIAYIYKWKRKGPLNLSYRIIECSNKRIKLNISNTTIPQITKDSLSCNNSSQSDISKCDKIPSSIEKSSDWKEVQLQISETGIMSVTGITLADNALSTNDIDNSTKVNLDASACTKLEDLTPLLNQSTCSNYDNSTKLGTEIIEQERDSPQVQIRQSGTAECNNNSKEPLVFTDSDPAESVSETINKAPPPTPVTKGKRCKSVVDVCGNTTKELLHKPQAVKSSPVMVVAPTQNIKKTNSGSMGYKTLKVPPKTWNPSITRSSYLHSKNQASNLDSNVNVSNVNPAKSTEKAPRFFKMRNMPRYLGNPASGVKPMYQVAGNSKVPNPTPKPMVMKIDPKTLSPIVTSNTSPGPQNKAFYSLTQTTANRDQGSRFSSPTGTSNTMNIARSLNSATLNMLASNPSFLPNATNFLYGNLANLAPPLLRAGSGSNMVPGLGAYHVMPPSINMLFPHHHTHTPAVQRIPPSKNNALTKSPLQSSADCYPVAKSNVLNPKNGIDSIQIKKSTDPTSFKPKNSEKDQVVSANQPSNNLELNVLNNNNNDDSTQNSIQNNETDDKSTLKVANSSEKDKDVAKVLHITGEREVHEYDKDEDHRREKPEMRSSETCVMTEEEKSPLALCNPATLKTDKACYSDTKSKDTIEPLQKKT